MKCQSMISSFFIETASNMSGISMTHNLQSLLPPNSTTHFYRYKGSLTTPACNEVVTWTVFKNYATISKAQVNP